MADFFRFGVAQINGTATITVNGDVVSSAGSGGAVFLEAGTSNTVTVTLDDGYVSFSATAPFVTGGPFTSTPFSFTMPFRDTRMVFDISGVFTPVDDFGPKYQWDWFTGTQARKLEIYEDGYVGSVQFREIQNLKYVWGNLGDSAIKTLIGSKIVFDIIANNTDFNEFLTGNNRKFKVLYYHGSTVVFEGYVNTDRITVPEQAGVYPITFEAVDGIKGFDSTRFIEQRIPTGVFPNAATRFLIGALNQTFVDGRPVNICADIYEDGMDSDNCLYDNFQMPFAALFEGGEVAKFSDGTRIVNEYLYVGEVLKRLANPFFCRVFLYMNEWYVVRLAEYRKNTMRFFRFLADGTLDGVTNRTNGYDLSCPNFGNATREGGLIYNEFTSILKLGFLDNSAQGGIYTTSFGLESWSVGPQSSTFAGYYRLIGGTWSYNRVTEYKGLPLGSDPDIAELMYVDSNGGFGLMFKSTTTAGLNDPNISYIELRTASSGIPIGVVQEGSNTISISLDYTAFKFLDPSSLGNPNPNTTFLGMRVKIGNNWLKYDVATNAFSWEATETDMTFPLGTVGWGESTNKLRIVDIPVPATDNVEVRIYQMIITAGTRSQYSLGLQNFVLDVGQTEGLANAEIAYKSETLQDYNRVYPDYITWIGDALTANSFSAIKLIDNSVSESWTTSEVVSQPLQAIQVQELANFKGRRNLRILGKLYQQAFPVLWQRMDYDGSKWCVTYSSYDEKNDVCEIEMFQIDD
jgi:hypothetical protein